MVSKASTYLGAIAIAYSRAPRFSRLDRVIRAAYYRADAGDLHGARRELVRARRMVAPAGPTILALAIDHAHDRLPFTAPGESLESVAGRAALEIA